MVLHSGKKTFIFMLHPFSWNLYAHHNHAGGNLSLGSISCWDDGWSCWDTVFFLQLACCFAGGVYCFQLVNPLYRYSKAKRPVSTYRHSSSRRDALGLALCPYLFQQFIFNIFHSRLINLKTASHICLVVDFFFSVSSFSKTMIYSQQYAEKEKLLPP